MIGINENMDQVIRADLAQAISVTDIWMRQRKSAALHHTATGATAKAASVTAAALAKSLTGSDWLASYNKFFP